MNQWTNIQTNRTSQLYTYVNYGKSLLWKDFQERIEKALPRMIRTMYSRSTTNNDGHIGFLIQYFLINIATVAILPCSPRPSLGWRGRGNILLKMGGLNKFPKTRTWLSSLTKSKGSPCCSSCWQCQGDHPLKMDHTTWQLKTTRVSWGKGVSQGCRLLMEETSMASLGHKMEHLAIIREESLHTWSQALCPQYQSWRGVGSKVTRSQSSPYVYDFRLQLHFELC